MALAAFLPFSSWPIQPFPFPFILFLTLSIVVLLPLFYLLWFRRPDWALISDEGISLRYKKRTYMLAWEKVRVRNAVDIEYGTNSYTIDWRGSPAWFPLPISIDIFDEVLRRGGELGYDVLDQRPI